MGGMAGKGLRLGNEGAVSGQNTEMGRWTCGDPIPFR